MRVSKKLIRKWAKDWEKVHEMEAIEVLRRGPEPRWALAHSEALFDFAREIRLRSKERDADPSPQDRKVIAAWVKLVRAHRDGRQD